MTERIRSLLDAAVADARPRAADPVPEVLRRSRAARRRHLATAGAAGVVAVALLTTGGLVAGGAGTTPAGTDPSAAAGPTPPALPSIAPTKGAYERPKVAATVVDGAVRIHGLILPVPDGWQVLSDPPEPLSDCQIPEGSVLINVGYRPSGMDCPKVPAQIHVRWWQPPVGRIGRPRQFQEGLSEVVLPGGQPAWLTDNEVNNVRASQRHEWSVVSEVQLPWAGADLAWEMTSKSVPAFVSSVTSDPVPARRLVLPETASSAYLAVRSQDQIHSTDASAVSRVLDRLRGLDRVVRDGELPCASAPELVPGWRLAGKDMVRLTFSYPSGLPQAVVAISSTDDCAFATSSMGGRVWLPPGFLAELRGLLAPGAR
ncbi:hypothetical protein EV384_0117 [Micromonospora kangleipakensis]|uniref:Uncharacterized protein n=1 Tax=Micromonospora kangleipakensis TaxID=1077942 RepID=A0A4Q8B2T0_9ACTN|nr:hypothetical protein [Micromonospora kangleipakensis]RZU71784.1 hypothetical protein EV384_0117 [Micromonospora kangleipakensis]